MEKKATIGKKWRNVNAGEKEEMINALIKAESLYHTASEKKQLRVNT